MEILGKVIGIYSRSPSFSGGMNSCPSFGASATAESVAKTPMATVEMGRRKATYTNGRYSLIKKRDTGCLDSGTMRPRISKSRSAGAKVIDNSAAASMTNVLV
jgi:hypothetical protein